MHKCAICPAARDMPAGAIYACGVRYACGAVLPFDLKGAPMKHIITGILILSILCANLLACNNAVPDRTADTTDAATSEIPAQTDTDAAWNAVGGSENPYKELYGTAVSGFLVADGTFTRVSTYYDAEGQAKWYHALDTYDAKTAGVPLLVYLIREMGITRAEYIHYLNAIGAAYTDSTLDVLFSADDDLINETFHSPLTLYRDGSIYTVYDLAAMEDDNAGMRQFPEEKIAELYANIQSFNAQSHTSVPEAAAEIYREMAAIASSATATGDTNQN